MSAEGFEEPAGLKLRWSLNGVLGGAGRERVF
jgi:hypothetical protein